MVILHGTKAKGCDSAPQINSKRLSRNFEREGKALPCCFTKHEGKEAPQQSLAVLFAAVCRGDTALALQDTHGEAIVSVLGLAMLGDSAALPSTDACSNAAK